MNFRIDEIEKCKHLENGKYYDYILWLGLSDDPDNVLPLRATHSWLLNFKEVQLAFLRKHDRVLTLGKNGTLASWEYVVDAALRGLWK